MALMTIAAIKFIDGKPTISDGAMVQLNGTESIRSAANAIFLKGHDRVCLSVVGNIEGLHNCVQHFECSVDTLDDTVIEMAHILGYIN